MCNMMSKSHQTHAQKPCIGMMLSSTHARPSTILEQDVVFSLRCWRRWRGLYNHLTSNPLQRSVCSIKHLPSWFFYSLTPFCRDKVSETCCTMFYRAASRHWMLVLKPVSECAKSKGKVHQWLMDGGDVGGGDWSRRGLVEVVQGNHWGVGLAIEMLMVG